MKKYNRLKLSRRYVPIILGITITFMQNIIIGLIMFLIWILIDVFLIEPKLPSFRKRREGEVFVIEPIKNMYFFAKVIKTQIQIDDSIMNGGHLVYIFKQTDNPMDIPEFFDPNNLVIPPQIIDNKGWKKGHFQTIGVQQVTNQEHQLNYGFWDIESEKLVNEEGKELELQPDIHTDFGISSYGSIVDELIEAVGYSTQTYK